jgi:MFS family permease
MRVFNLVWAGQAVSMIGTAMTVFGLGVWVFGDTGSPTAFATLVMSGSLPGLLVLPLAGALVDRWDRRRVMLLSDLGTALAPLAALALVETGTLRLWHLYVLVALGAVFKAFQWPAFSSLVPQLVTKDDLGRANARVALAEAGAMVFGDLLGGVLYGFLGLRGLLLADLATFALALGTTLVSYRRVPAMSPAAPAGETSRGPLRGEVLEGWRFIRRRRGLFGLLVFFAANNLVVEMALVLVAPLVLSGHEPSTLGVVNAVGGLGMVLVSGVISFTRQPSRQVRAILAVATLHGFLLFWMGAGHTPWVLAAGLFGILGGFGVTNAVTATLWQRKTPTEVQGRVFAVRRMIAWSADPVAYGLAGPVAVHLGAPLAAADGPLGGLVGHLTGSGPGAGIAAVFVLAGPALLAVVAWCGLRPRIRHLESELPDVVHAAA